MRGPVGAFGGRERAAGSRRHRRTASGSFTHLGGTNDDAGRGIAVDGAGSAYVTGLTYSPSFPTTPGAYDRTFGGPGTAQVPTDAFVTKLDPAGAAPVYSTFLGGRSFDAGEEVAVDGAGAAYVAGTTNSDDFPDVGGLSPTLQGGQDPFVAKLDPAGAALGYSTYLGGPDNEQAWGLAVDSAGAAYATGYTSSTFPTTSGAYATAYRGGPQDGFVAKLTGGVQRTLTVTTSGTGQGTVTGPGIDCGGAGHTDCSETVADGSKITLTATAASGSSFTTFNGAGCGSSSPCTVTMDADKTADASFAADAAGATPPPTEPAPPAAGPRRRRAQPRARRTWRSVAQPAGSCSRTS